MYHNIYCDEKDDLSCGKYIMGDICVDIESARSLELVVSQSKHTIVSLLGTMDRCLTPMGRRLLRASILQPSCDERLILDRQSCVAELVANRSLCISLQV